MSTAAEKLKAKRARKPIYMRVAKLIDPETGELVGALVPWGEIDQRLMRERKYRNGREVRAELKQVRDYWKHKLMHKIGGLLIDNVDGFEHMQSHAAVKKIQSDSNTCCDEETFVLELGQFGRHEVKRSFPRSMAFDEMLEEEFNTLFNGVTKWIGEKYSHVMLDEVRAEFWEMSNAVAAA